MNTQASLFVHSEDSPTFHQHRREESSFQFSNAVPQNLSSSPSRLQCLQDKKKTLYEERWHRDECNRVVFLFIFSKCRTYYLHDIPLISVVASFALHLGRLDFQCAETIMHAPAETHRSLSSLWRRGECCLGYVRSGKGFLRYTGYIPCI